MREQALCSSDTRGQNGITAMSDGAEADHTNNYNVEPDESSEWIKELGDALMTINDVAIDGIPTQSATKLIHTSAKINALFRKVCRKLDYERGRNSTNTRKQTVRKNTEQKSPEQSSRDIFGNQSTID